MNHETSLKSRPSQVWGVIPTPALMRMRSAECRSIAFNAQKTAVQFSYDQAQQRLASQPQVASGERARC